MFATASTVLAFWIPNPSKLNEVAAAKANAAQ